MSTNRRNFLRNITLGSSALAAGIYQTHAEGNKYEANTSRNMSGYNAGKLDKIRVGIIGLGMRGPDAAERMTYIENVEITALCDLYEDRVLKTADIITKAGLPKPALYSGNKDAWKKMCERNDIDLIYICTPWRLHTPMAVYAMKNGKHAATEVPAAVTLDECWQLVETSESTGMHCMMLENCCYDFFEQLTLSLVRAGMLGETVHAEGAYIHDLRELNFMKDKDGGYAEMWRLNENATRNGNLYPTHGLGPVAQCLNINRGDQMDYLVSISTNDFMMQEIAKVKAKQDDFFSPYVNKSYRGNMNTTIIKTHKGKTIMLQHDVTSPRPYSRIHLVSGTKGVASKWPSPERIAFGHSWIKKDALDELYQKYQTPLVKHVGEIAKKVGGHGGMDFIMDWRLIDCLRNGLPLDQDVYDAALWSAIAPLSEKSVAKRGRSMDIPDFTRGKWKTNQPVDISLEKGKTTGIRLSE
jgi:hypothetical protein